MMSESCREWRPALGPWVLGQLESSDADGLVAHLADCDVCPAEVAELTEVAAAMRVADPLRVETQPPQPPAGLADAVSARIAVERSAAGRTRTRGILAAAAVAVVAVVAAVAWWPTGEEPAAADVVVAAAAQGVDATIGVEDRGWGASVRIVMSGFESGSAFTVWVEDGTGTRHLAGTFLGMGDDEITCYMAAAVRLDDAVRVGIDDAGGTPVLRGHVSAPATARAP